MYLLAWCIPHVRYKMLRAMVHFVFLTTTRNRTYFLSFPYFFRRIPQSVNWSTRAWKLNDPLHFSDLINIQVDVIRTFSSKKKNGIGKSFFFLLFLFHQICIRIPFHKMIYKSTNSFSVISENRLKHRSAIKFSFLYSVKYHFFC